MDIIEKIRELLGTRRRLDEISRRLELNIKAISAAGESNRQEHRVQNERLDNILAEHKQSERDRTTNNVRNYRIQNSIRWAAWCTFASAVVYGVITFRLWHDANNNFIVNQRAWVGVDRPVEVESLAFDAQRSGKMSFVVTTKNFGKSVARSTAIRAEVVSAAEEIKQASERTCGEAEGMSRIHDARTAPNSAFPFPDYPSFGVMFPGETSGHHYGDVQFKSGKVPWPPSVVGCIAYEDEFGNYRRTRFCYGYNWGDSSKYVAPAFLYQCAIGPNDAN